MTGHGWNTRRVWNTDESVMSGSWEESISRARETILREAKQVGKLTRRIGAHVAEWPSRTSDRTPELSTSTSFRAV